MKNKIFITITCLLILLSAIVVGTFAINDVQTVAEVVDITQSFEDMTVPSNWNIANGELAISDKRYKLGQKSLAWNIAENDSIKIAEEKNMLDASAGRNIKSCGFVMWVYSVKNHEGEKLSFELGDQQQLDEGKPLTFSFDFHLNFKGWRALWVRLAEDSTFNWEDLNKYINGSLKLNTMIVKSSSGITGNTIYFDALQFGKNIFWNRASDYQLLSEKRVDDGKNELTNWSGAYIYSQRKPVIPLRSITNEDISNFQSIEKRLNDWILGTGKFNDKYSNPRIGSLSSMVKSSKNKYNSLNISIQEGVWTGKPLFCAESPFVDQGDKFTRGTAETIFLPLALDYKINGNQDSLDMLMNLYDYWNDQGWAYGSGIGSLDHETLRASGYFASVYVVREELKLTNRLSREEKTLEWYSEFGKVYPNSGGVYEQTTADEMRTHFLNRLIRVMIMEDSPQKVQAMESYLEWVNGALKINPNRGDTIKPDFTGFHHNNVYMNAYPPHGYHMASMINYILSDTKFAMGKDARYNLKQALITHDMMSNTNVVPFQVRGRFPVQNSDIGQEIIPSYAYMALSGDPISGDSFDMEMAQLFMRKWENLGASGQRAVKGYNIWGISFINSYGALEVIFELLERGVKIGEIPQGFWNLPYAGMAVTRQDDWLVAVKGYSKYLWDYEAGSSENMYGRYSAYGMINVLSAGVQRDGINYINDISNGYDYNNGWDWNRLAGTTTINLPLDKLHSNNNSYRNYSDKTFLGSTSLDGEGVWGMELHDKTFNDTFTAKKTVFMLGDEIVVLGSDISNNDNENNTETTLFQNAIYDSKLPIIFSGKTISDFPYDYKSDNSKSAWLIDPYNVGYYLPDASGLNITRKTQNSKRADGKTASSGNYSTAWINHGKNPQSAGYEYAMIINANSEKMSSYASKKPYAVLKKDSSAHVVSKESQGVIAYAIFNTDATLPNSGIIRSTDTPILAYSKKSNDNSTLISISDPDLRIGGSNEPVMQNSVMKRTRVSLSGKQKLIGNYDNVRVVESTFDKTIIEIDCIDGQSINFEVEEEFQQYQMSVENGSGGGKYKCGDVVTIECNKIDGKTFSHWSAEGIELSQEQINSANITFTMPSNNVTLTANYIDEELPIVYLDLKVDGGSGGGKYKCGDVVTIECNKIDGKTFSHWSAEGIELSQEQINSANITFTMTNNNVTLIANYVSNDNTSSDNSDSPSPNNTWIYVGVGCGSALLVIGLIIIFKVQSKKPRRRG